MSPKSALLTAGTTSLQPPKPLGRKPITTQEKLQVAAYKRFMAAKPKALSPPPDTDTTTPKKKAKPKAIPPPGEAFQEVSAKKKAKMTGLNNKKRKPITTQEKIRAAEIKKGVAAGMRKIKRADAKRAAKEAEGEGSGGGWKAEMEKKGNEKGENDGKGKKEVKSAGGGKKTKAYRPSALSVLTMSTAPTATKFEDRKGKGVLMRPTERAKAEKHAMEMRNQLAKRSPKGRIENVRIGKVEKKKTDVPFRLMDLPAELRNRIWEMAVVHTPFCVWPGEKKGREQPDLAMSGREVRDEVLPVFYGSNFFGVDITPIPGVKDEPEIEEEEGPEEVNVAEKAEEMAKSKAEVKCQAQPDEQRCDDSVSEPFMSHNVPAGATAQLPPDPIDEIKPWAVAPEASGHLSKIQHWIFSSSPELPITGPNRIPQIDNANSFVVYLNIWREEGYWRANVKVHREACCVLPGQKSCGKCVIRNSPDWLNRMVGLVLERAEGRGVTADMIAGMGKVLRARAQELVGVRCTDIGKQVGDV